ncbi:MAG: DUF86 domain-containing protein [Candidatus Celaenobacter antarcticus]|nr:DUF86 domain-containing protein [Candidatus Celaenobacter antarcticus]
MKTKNDSVYLEHILDSIKWIESYISDISREHFLANHLVQDAIIRQVEIIGEASKKLSISLKQKYPNIPWKDIVGMRDKLIHGYFGVDIEAVWKTVEDDIPILKEQVSNITNKP